MEADGVRLRSARLVSVVAPHVPMAGGLVVIAGLACCLALGFGIIMERLTTDGADTGASNAARLVSQARSNSDRWHDGEVSPTLPHVADR